MKINWKQMALVIGLVFTNQSITMAQVPIDYNKIQLGKKVSIPELPKEGTFYALEKTKEDVNGDKVKDVVLLVGEKDDPKSLLTKNVHLVITDGKTKKTYAYLFRKKASYSPKLYFGDLNGDGVMEILNEFPDATGSSKSYSIGTFEGNVPQLLVTEEEIAKVLAFTGKFEDNFVMKLKNTYLKTTAPVTLEGFHDFYVLDGIYDKNGNLKEKVITDHELINMYFEDKDNNGVEELHAEVLVKGISDSNVVARAFAQFEMKDKELVLLRMDVCGSMYLKE